MSRPHVYIHRLTHCPYEWYMNDENEALLASFADVTNNGRGTEPVSLEEMIKSLQGVTGILSLNGSNTDEITTEILKEVGTVKVAAISHWWHGSHDRAREAWQAAGIKVIDTSDACNEAVAEWSVGAIIAGLRRFEYFDREMKSGVRWPDRHGMSSQVCGSTIGLVGLGRCGRIAARYLQPYDARVIAYDPFVDESAAAEMGVELVDLETLLKTADAVSLHMRVTDATRAMIGAKELAMMKDGALLVNSARAALLDNDALRAELPKKRIRAYLDVFDPEPPELDDVLRALDNVVLTPHVAGSTDLMFLRCGTGAIEALRDYFQEH